MKKPTKPNKQETINDLVRLTDKENPKPEDMERLRKRLDDDAYLVEINESSQRAFDAVIKTYSTSALMKEICQRQVKEKRNALDYESENVMVRMLIDRVIMCHIRLNAYEMFHAEKIRENLSIASGVYWDKLLGSYQRRLLSAIESLAKVKRLLSEAEFMKEKVRNKKSQSTANSMKTYKMLGG